MAPGEYPGLFFGVGMLSWFKKKSTSEFVNRSTRVGRAQDPVESALLELSISCLDVEDDDVVLEVGFGVGDALIRLLPILSRGRLAGIDSDGESVAEARSILLTEFSQFKVDLKEGVVSRLPFGDRSFTRVLCRQGVGAWLNPAKGLAEVFRVLEPKGAFALVLPSAARSQGKIFGSLEVRNLLRQAGFDEPRVWEGEGLVAGTLAMHVRRP